MLDALDEPDFEHAVERDLIGLGLRLRQLGDGSGVLTWHDVAIVIEQADRSSAIGRAALGEHAEWGAAEYLLAAAVDALNAANWQRSGKASSPRPKPVPRPGDGVVPVSDGEGDPFDPNQSGTFVGVPTPIDELNEWLGWAA